MALSQRRKEEIALLYVKEEIKKEGREIFSLKPNEMRRNICNTAHNLGISEEEATDFVIDLITEKFDNVLKNLNASKKEGKVGFKNK